MISDSISPQELKVVEWLRNNNLTNYFSDFVEREDAYSRLISGIMGWQWEDEFKALCELRNLVCMKSPLNERYDLIVNSKRVQCKFTTSDCAIDIRNKDKTFNRRYRPDDFDYMALNINMDIYIVPIHSLLDKTLTQTRQSVKINEILEFKDKWTILES